MNKRDAAKYEKLLLEKRKQLIEEFGLLKKAGMDNTIKDGTGDISSYSYHMADQGTDAMEREKTFYFASKSGRLLYHIDEALRRVRNGTYGKCAECGQEINRERLKAVPHARMCIKCKELEEERKRRG
jgi:DnaK suppressor protein